MAASHLQSDVPAEQGSSAPEQSESPQERADSPQVRHQPYDGIAGEGG
jgi:hypothetical protein